MHFVPCAETPMCAGNPIRAQTPILRYSHNKQTTGDQTPSRMPMNEMYFVRCHEKKPKTWAACKYGRNLSMYGACFMTYNPWPAADYDMCMSMYIFICLKSVGVWSWSGCPGKNVWGITRHARRRCLLRGSELKLHDVVVSCEWPPGE